MADKVQYYLAQFDKELSKYPLAVEIEKRANVPKTYIVGGVGALAFILVFFNIWGNLLTNLLGFLWPAYQSFKAIESTNKDDDRQWLTYWVVYAVMNLIEHFSDYVLYWLPFYYIFKAGIILYLILPQFNGAQVIYLQFIRPYLLKEEKIIDSNLEKIKAKAGAALTEIENELSGKRD